MTATFTCRTSDSHIFVEIDPLKVSTAKKIGAEQLGLKYGDVKAKVTRGVLIDDTLYTGDQIPEGQTGASVDGVQVFPKDLAPIA